MFQGNIKKDMRKVIFWWFLEEFNILSHRHPVISIIIFSSHPRTHFHSAQHLSLCILGQHSTVYTHLVSGRQYRGASTASATIYPEGNVLMCCSQLLTRVSCLFPTNRHHRPRGQFMPPTRQRNARVTERQTVGECYPGLGIRGWKFLPQLLGNVIYG